MDKLELAVVQAESPGDAPAPEDALVTFGPDGFPRHFGYLRRGMIHNRYDLLHHGMQYALSPDKINKYEEVNDASIVDSDPRNICGIAGRGCSLLCWKVPPTYRRILNEFGNVITSGRVGSFITVLVNTCGEECVMQCHDYVSVPNGTTVHSLRQIEESPYQVHHHSFACAAFGRHNCLTMNIHNGDVTSPRTVALVGGSRRQMCLRLPTIVDWDEYGGLALPYTPLTSVEHIVRDGNDYAAPLQLHEGISDFFEGQSYYQLNGHTVFDPVADGYDLGDIDTVGGTARTAPLALYTRETRLAGVTLTRAEEELIAGVNLARLLSESARHYFCARAKWLTEVGGFDHLV